MCSHQYQNSLLYGLSGGLSKVIASVATYPAQVVKTRLQQDAEVTGTQRYSNVANVISRTIKCVVRFVHALGRCHAHDAGALWSQERGSPWVLQRNGSPHVPRSSGIRCYLCGLRECAFHAGLNMYSEATLSNYNHTIRTHSYNTMTRAARTPSRLGTIHEGVDHILITCAIAAWRRNHTLHFHHCAGHSRLQRSVGTSCITAAPSGIAATSSGVGMRL